MCFAQTQFNVPCAYIGHHFQKKFPVVRPGPRSRCQLLLCEKVNASRRKIALRSFSFTTNVFLLRRRTRKTESKIDEASRSVTCWSCDISSVLCGNYRSEAQKGIFNSWWQIASLSLKTVSTEFDERAPRLLDRMWDVASVVDRLEIEHQRMDREEPVAGACLESFYCGEVRSCVKRKSVGGVHNQGRQGNGKKCRMSWHRQATDQACLKKDDIPTSRNCQPCWEDRISEISNEMESVVFVHRSSLVNCYRSRIRSDVERTDYNSRGSVEVGGPNCSQGDMSTSQKEEIARDLSRWSTFFSGSI